MPDRKTLERAAKDESEGTSPSTQAGEFVREEIHHVREGKHGARSPQQAIAIGLSKARRAGIKVKPPAKDKTSESTRRKAERDYERGHGEGSSRRTSARRSAATSRALKREPRESASRRSLSARAHAAAGTKSISQRSTAARQAPRTNGRGERSAAAKKPARMRRARRRA